ncbi:YafY family transcriptional regulator [Streptomyces caniferus]|uniref:helix-turn-helix transcriptional regulator n=1 Tax=Streptomyces caniferus TaxID=285557 RepID=UPI002E2DC024|nr:YafY family protein [Streptomyces caniferus]
MTTSTARVLALLEILQGSGLHTVPDLAVRLGVDERTVRRYVGHLLELGVPVDSVRGRHGGYRLAPGYRMPPLMLTDEEALAVLLGLLTGRRAGLVTTSAAANESATAKLRRVLPKALGRRLDALLETADFTARPRPTTTPAPEAHVLLELAEAARHQRPVTLNYTDRKGRSTDRTVLPYGLVAHSGRWYLTAAAPAAPADTAGPAGPTAPAASASAAGEEIRTFRLDRITSLTVQPGSFTVPPDFDPVTTLLDGLAQTPWTHEVSLRIHADAQHIRRHLPAGIASLTVIPDGGGDGGADWDAGAPDAAQRADTGRQPRPDGSNGPATADDHTAGGDHTTGWVHVRMRAERLDWIPPVLAALDRPFVIERPTALRDLVRALARRLDEHATADAPAHPPM